MIVKPTSIFFIGECEIQTDRCTAKTPAPITAVKAEPTGDQIDVCHACLEEMIREGQWEVKGARVSPRFDLAVFDRDDRPQLVADVKTLPRISTALRQKAIQVRRNLLVHSAIPNSRFLLIIYYPAKAFLWSESDATPTDAEPNYEIDLRDTLIKQEPDQAGALSDHEVSEIAVSNWLRKTLEDSLSANASAPVGWLRESGLYEAIKGGHLIGEATRLAA